LREPGRDETLRRKSWCGALSYGGGDSNAIIADELEDLLEELERNSAT